MIRVDYQMTALQPIFTGSDENAGTIRTFRREKVLLGSPLVQTSAFQSEKERRQALVDVLDSVWHHIDFEGMDNSRKMKIWDEFSSKVLTATGVPNRVQFLNRLCHAFDIRSLSDVEVADILEKFTDDEFLQMIRDELQYLILLLRRRRQEAKEIFEAGKKKESSLSLFEEEKPERAEIEEVPALMFQKNFDWIPFLSGNSIRGILRRLVMRDFCKQAGIVRLSKDNYHQLFTGGNITDSTRFEDIGHREEYIWMCPMIGLLGSAIGNMTIEGDLKVGCARPVCREHGNGEVSFWELLGIEFGTRRDDSKLETDIAIVALDEEAPTTQMKYGYEVLVVGTRLTHQFVCTAEDSLGQSAFWRMLKLFKEQPFIGGLSAVGNGEVQLGYEVPEGSDREYLEHLSENREAIQEYFNAKIPV